MIYVLPSIIYSEAMQTCDLNHKLEYALFALGDIFLDFLLRRLEFFNCDEFVFAE